MTIREAEMQKVVDAAVNLDIELGPRRLLVNGMTTLTSEQGAKLEALIDAVIDYRCRANASPPSVNDIKVNGVDHPMAGEALSYDQVCWLANIDPATQPSMTVRWPSVAGVEMSRAALSVAPGETCPIDGNPIFNVYNTGNA